MRPLLLFVVLLLQAMIFPVSDLSAQVNITRVEYYIDIDPGFGNATVLSIIPGNNLDDLQIPVNPNTLTEGVHRLYVRAQDGNGSWSLTNSWLFYKPYEALVGDPVAGNIVAAEYYIDTDPGPGKAIQLPVTPATDLSDLIIPINTDRLTPCEHKIHIRAKDADGRWSLVNSYTFLNESISPAAAPFDFMVKFDGVNDYLDLGTWFNQSTFTLSFWIRPDAIQGSGAAVAAIQNDLYLYANPAAPGNYVLSHLLQYDMLPNEWNHVTITVDGATNTRKFYLFGQLVDSNQWNYMPQNGFNLKFGNGGFFPAAYFKGSLDEIKLWDHVLTPEGIYSNVSRPLTGNEPGLIGYWNFNNGCEITAPDLTVNNHPAHLKNGLAKTPSTVTGVGQQIVPNKAGKSRITVKIYDNLFQNGAVARLSRSGFEDIVADTTVISDTGSLATCIFNLANKETGLYDIKILNPDSTVKTYANSFTVEEIDTASTLDVQMLGSNVYRRGRVFKFFITFRNNSNIDIAAPPFSLRSFRSSYIALSPENLKYKWQFLPLLFGNQRTGGSTQPYPYVDSVLSPGETYTIPVYSVDSTTVGGRTSSLTPCEELDMYVLDGIFPNRPGFNGNNGSYPIQDFINDGHNYIDGCSNPSIVVDLINLFMDSNVNWNNVFLPACSNHDLCYQTCYAQQFLTIPNFRAKDICDNEFFRRMNLICENYSGNKEDCKAAALAYYRGVKLFGGQAFRDNQALCTGGPDDPPVLTSGPTYAIPDCNSCPGQICFVPKPIGSFDPNEKIGPSSFQNGHVDFNYVIKYENLATATAAAQEVLIIDTLDKSKFDISTFSFGNVGFGNTDIDILAKNDKQFSRHIDLRLKKNLILKIEGRLDTASGIAYWKFISLDPATMLLTEDPYEGFLPQNTTSPEGEGFVSFNIRPWDTLKTGTPIQNKATIIFDLNQPIITNIQAILIDKILPNSRVLPIDVQQSDTNFIVRWAGTDTMSGIKHYNIYVSVDQGNFIPWKINSSDTSAIYPGRLNHQYSFYSIATDSAGNIEAPKIVAEATTLLRALPLKLLNFTATVINQNTVRLSWKTENEINTSHFEMEHSLNGALFSKIGLSSAANAPGAHFYHFTHEQIDTGANYYRLRMVDTDGNFTYSKIIKVDVGGDDQIRFDIFPNPAKSFITIRGAGLRQITLFSSAGKILNTYKANGANENSFPLTGYSPGVYYIKLVDSNNYSDTRKIIIH